MDVKQLIDRIRLDGKKLAAFVIEGLISCGGQFITPPGYLRLVAK